MKNDFTSIAIVGKYMDPVALQLMQNELAQLARHITNKGFSVWIEEQTAQHAELTGFNTASLALIGEKANLVIIMGGDGTMLSVARSLLNYQLPLVGINRGRLGFLTDLTTDNMLDELDKMLAGESISETRMLLDATVFRQEQVVYKAIALNDVVVKSAFRLIELEVQINQQFVSRQRADGLIISSPTGTTAYALSAGGPILHPDLDAISIVPISPHTLSNRPITVTSESDIEVSIVHATDAQLSFDGQGQWALQEGDKIQILRAKQDVTLMHPSSYCYFDMLRNKLNWG